MPGHLALVHVRPPPRRFPRSLPTSADLHPPSSHMTAAARRSAAALATVQLCVALMAASTRAAAAHDTLPPAAGTARRLLQDPPSASDGGGTDTMDEDALIVANAASTIAGTTKRRLIGSLISHLFSPASPPPRQPLPGYTEGPKAGWLLITRGPGRTPGASVYTRKRLSVSRGPGRKPCASAYTRKRLYLTGAKAKARCLLTHTEAYLSYRKHTPDLFPRLPWPGHSSPCQLYLSVRSYGTSAPVHTRRPFAAPSFRHIFSSTRSSTPGPPSYVFHAQPSA
jgi:hypothetical protein